MKKTISKIIGGTVLAVLMAAIFTQIWVSAQDMTKEQQEMKEQSDNFSALYSGATLQGVWQGKVTFRNCSTGAAVSPAFDSLSTFFRDGTMTEFGVASGMFRSAGQGIWKNEGGLNYSNTFQFFRFNPDGTYAEKVVARQQIEFRPDNIYNVSARIEFYDPNGNLLRRGCATGTATRLE